MKIKLLLATLVGAVALNGAVAGEWCPPAPAKCPVECCDDANGYVGVSYMTDYIFRGVRHARDTVGAHASYTIDNCFLPVTLGVNHYSSLSSDTTNYLGTDGDHTNFFAEAGLPSLCGFDLKLRYDHYMYPNLRNDVNGLGDSHGQLGLTVAREVLCGLTVAYTAAYDFNAPAYYNTLAVAPGSFLNNADNGGWIHTLDLSKSLDITDCIALDLSAGVLYTDNIWGNGSGSQRSAGWNNWYAEAALPIAVGQCATLTPYVGYNGTPDSWLADDYANGIPGANRNDVFHGGVRLGVAF